MKRCCLGGGETRKWEGRLRAHPYVRLEGGSGEDRMGPFPHVRGKVLDRSVGLDHFPFIYL